jgi:hypothetical protein
MKHPKIIIRTKSLFSYNNLKREVNLSTDPTTITTTTNTTTISANNCRNKNYSKTLKNITENPV